ncbi:winged helix-turn-helix domain-containing tetratricopeptide repeat protein [Microvirga sp. 17 mud 1-3]|uniref:winged helix-turn-helix domain-containing tetratricopeptide repeat protein n=1 Tax=Microvirga sp. 17 mud 1-3 TaxID=2082949 RepID=UPI000D6BC511|nr:winged helix-turn-helix domain-containing tetratricopeptide repeat protein [Microvirga sp. 17 mud 1-3]AWM85521.1 CadC-family transcriptional regulator [Microvirga sp. 17 mud 1-3]
MQFTFGSCSLDPDRRELTRGSDTIALGPRAFDLLLYLVQHSERVVSKQELLHAIWGGRIVSESTMTSHVNAVRNAIGDSGSEQRLVRTVARKGFRFVADVRVTDHPNQTGITGQDRTAPKTSPSPAPKVDDRPSIAVMPFLNLSADPAQEYFADGVVEDIIAALSRLGWLFVIARNSSFTYKGRAVDATQVGRDLGVRYLLVGSVRKAEDRVRITGQLIEAATGLTVWAERFESSLNDIFQVQDEVVASVVGTIVPQLERAEMERACRKPAECLNAYDYYLRGLARFHQGTKEAISQALPLFFRVIELDPDYAAGYGMAAWCHVWRKLNGWLADPAREAAEGASLAHRAIELGWHDPVALTRGGHALGHFGGDLDGCIALLDRALVLNPNLLAAWYLSGFQRITRGEPDDAIKRFAKGMRLSPLDPEMPRMQAGTALAHMLAGNYDHASSWASKALKELPSFALAVGVLAASDALAGRRREAQRTLRDLRQLNPSLRISNIGDWVQFRRPADLNILAEGLRRSGLPD